MHLESADKIDEAHYKYQKSEKRVVVQTKFQKTDKFRNSLKKYNKSELGKQAHLRYILSEKGKSNIKKHNEKRKLMVRVAAWIEKNPGKTALDFFSQCSAEDTKIFTDSQEQANPSTGTEGVSNS